MKGSDNMKKIIYIIIGILTFGSASASAAEAWRDAFVSRIINAWSSDSSCTDIIMTDIDRNGIPEAFLVKPGTRGEIATGITMQNNTVIQIAVPHNISGDCLKDITVYTNTAEDEFVHVGREIARYANVITYYELKFDGHSLTAEKINKTKYSGFKAIAYRDTYSGDFFSNGYPNRTKLKDFIDNYQNLSQLTASISNARISVDGSRVNLPGYTVDNNNYYKIRDIAMILKDTSARFNVVWDESKNAVNIITNKKYTVVGGELEDAAAAGDLDIVLNSGGILKDGSPIDIYAYNINGNNYFKIRDIASLIGFSVGWDDSTQTITITTD